MQVLTTQEYYHSELAGTCVSAIHEPAKSEEQDQSTVRESQTHRIYITSQRRGIAIDELQTSSANKERISCARCPNNSAPHLNANF